MSDNEELVGVTHRGMMDWFDEFMVVIENSHLALNFCLFLQGGFF